MMGRPLAGVLFAMAMIIVIVGVDVLFFKDHGWERLMVNVGVVLVFAVCYLRFIHPS